MIVCGCRDTAGQERFRSMTRCQYRGTKVCACGVLFVSCSQVVAKLSTDLDVQMNSTHVLEAFIDLTMQLQICHRLD